MKFKLSRIFLSGYFILQSPALLAIELPAQLDLVYRAEVAGMNIGTLNRQLKRESEGHYTVNSETNARGIAALLMKDVYREESTFRVDKDMIYPLKYHQAPDKKPEKARIAIFDWEKRKVSLNNDRVYDISPGVQDPASFLFFWMLNPPAEGEKGTISLVDGKRMTKYEFKIIGIEQINTIWGEISALRIERQKEGEPQKILRMWLATDKQYLPVVIENVRPSYKMTFTLEKSEGL